MAFAHQRLAARNSGTGDLPPADLPASSEYSGIRLPDGRTLAWREYGHPRGVPCVLIPDARSSRLAPAWLLHETALPDGIRLIAIDPSGAGASDPVGFGGDDTTADDLSRLVQTLAVGRVVLVGIGGGADAALAFADHHPTLVSSAMAVSPRVSTPMTPPRSRHRFSRARPPWSGPLDAWAKAAGRGDLRQEATWVRSRRRMDPAALDQLGDAWLDADFRDAIAADLALTAARWVDVEMPPVPRWVSVWRSSVPVHVWHDRDEPDQAGSELHRIVADRPNWTLTAMPGNGLLLSAFAAILAAARDNYQRGLVR